MDTEVFNKLVKNVSLGREHSNYFLYEDTVCQIVCNRFPASNADNYRLVSIECDSEDYPFIDMPLMQVDLLKLAMLVQQPI